MRTLVRVHSLQISVVGADEGSADGREVGIIIDGGGDVVLIGDDGEAAVEHQLHDLAQATPIMMLSLFFFLQYFCLRI